MIRVKNIMNIFKKNGFYVMALVLVAGILAVSGIAGYVSGQKERGAENAVDFKDDGAGTALNAPASAETDTPIVDEMTGYNADLVQKILSMIENGSLALEDFEDEGSMNGQSGQNVSQEASAEGLHIEAKTCDEKLHINLQKDISLEKAQKSQVDNIKRQISKFGNTIFTVEDVIVEPTDFPWFIPNSILAEIRRQATDELMGRLSEMSENQKDTKTKDQAQQLPDNGKVSFHSISSYQHPYMYNIANRLAHSFYEQEGMSDITPAFEIRKPSSPLVMQCRYCLRHELGQCKKSHKQSGLLKEPLHLRLADGRTFRLEFDCKKCQMNIYADE